MWNEGRMTSAELEMEMKCYAYFEPPPQPLWAPSEPERPNAEKVLALAARWSLDPSAIEDIASREGPGIAGEFWQRKA